MCPNSTGGGTSISNDELRRAIDQQVADAFGPRPGVYAQEAAAEYPFLLNWKRDEARRMQACPKQRTKPPSVCFLFCVCCFVVSFVFMVCFD